jgi:hypothetical protein
VFSIRDTVWPLAWRLCLEPLPGMLGEGQVQWQYRCFDSPTQVMLRAVDDRVYGANTEPHELLARDALIAMAYHLREQAALVRS